MNILNVLKLSPFFIVLAGCATASGVSSGPNGKPIWAIEGPNAQATYTKASEKCPSGYAIVGNPTTNQYNNYLITVECK